MRVIDYIDINRHESPIIYQSNLRNFSLYGGSIVREIVTQCSDMRAVHTAGFVAGMTQVMCTRRIYDNETTELAILKRPLSTLVDAAFGGCIYGMCASFVGWMFPQKYVAIVPITLAIYTGYTVVNTLTK